MSGTRFILQYIISVFLVDQALSSDIFYLQQIRHRFSDEQIETEYVSLLINISLPLILPLLKGNRTI
jgi:hypothetical protein